MSPVGCRPEELARTIRDFSDTLRWTRRAREEDEAVLTPELELRAKRMAHRLVRAAELGASSGALQELHAIFDTRNVDTANKPLLLAWVHLLEVLVQEAELLYGPGTGPLKLRFVEGAVLKILRKLDDRIVPATPFDPFIFKVVVELTVQGVVRLVNRADLWTVHSEGAVGRRAESGLMRLWVAIVSRLRHLSWRLVLAQYRVPPRLNQAIDAIATEHLAALGDVLRLMLAVLVWAGKHAQEVSAFVDVAYAAIREAERFAELSGPAKQAYARALIVAFMEEIGFMQGRSQLFVSMVNGFLNGLIDSMVQLLNKRKPEWAMPNESAATA